MINAHRGNVLLHGLLHHPLKNPHRVVGIQLHMLGDIVDGERPIVVDGNIFQHLADVKLGVARNAVLMRARSLVHQNRLPAGEAQALEHQSDFIDR